MSSTFYNYLLYMIQESIKIPYKEAGCIIILHLLYEKKTLISLMTEEQTCCGLNNHISNAVILNQSFSLALSRFLLTIITPWLSVRYAHACINRMDSPTDKRGLFLNNLDIYLLQIYFQKLNQMH